MASSLPAARTLVSCLAFIGLTSKSSARLFSPMIMPWYVFSHYEPYKGAIDAGRKGVLVSNSDGETAAYALWNLEERGTMFVGAGEKTYQGMIIGENSRGDDLYVNPMKAKQLTNVRASGKDEAVRLTPPRRPTLEQAIAYIEDDELVEVTPKSIRLRKSVLNPSFRKKRVKEDA